MNRNDFSSGEYKKPPTLMVGGLAKISLVNYYIHFAKIPGIEPDLTCKLLEYDSKSENYVAYFKENMAKAVFNKRDLQAIE